MTFILPKKTRVLWQLRIAVAFLIALFIVLVIIPFNILRIIFVTVILLSGLFLIFIYVPIFVKTYKVVVDCESVCIYKGVIIKSVTILPRARMVFVKNLSTPLMAMLNLELVMFKASKGWVFVPEINKNTAQTLLRLIYGDHK